MTASRVMREPRVACATGPVVVTGASGFIGRRLVRALHEQDCVPEVTRVDVTDPAQLERWTSLGPSIVFHLAVARDQLRAQATNVVGTKNVLAAADGARVVHVGGALEHDSNSLYGSTKARATHAALDAGAVVVRPSFVYGPGQHPRKLIPTVLRAAREGVPVPVADAAPIDWVHVDDVVAACLAAASPRVPAGTLIDVGSGEGHSPEQVVAAAEAVTGRQILRRSCTEPPRPWDRERAAVDVTGLRQTLGVAPRSLRTGLGELWAETL